MDEYLIREDAAYVSPDGNYGNGILVFENDLLTDDQWEKLSEMSDGDRYEYAHAIITGNDEVVARIEQENFGEWEA